MFETSLKTEVADHAVHGDTRCLTALYAKGSPEASTTSTLAAGESFARCAAKKPIFIRNFAVYTNAS